MITGGKLTKTGSKKGKFLKTRCCNLQVAKIKTCTVENNKADLESKDSSTVTLVLLQLRRQVWSTGKKQAEKTLKRTIFSALEEGFQSLPLIRFR